MVKVSKVFISYTFIQVSQAVIFGRYNYYPDERNPKKIFDDGTRYPSQDIKLKTNLEILDEWCIGMSDMSHRKGIVVMEEPQEDDPDQVITYKWYMECKIGQGRCEKNIQGHIYCRQDPQGI